MTGGRAHDRAFSVYFCDPYGHYLELTTCDHELATGLLPS